MALERRRFMALGGLAAMGLVGRAVSDPSPADLSASLETVPTTEPAMPAPVAGGAATSAPAIGGAPRAAHRWALAVDVEACLGEAECDECTAACHRAHNVPDFENPKDEVKWIWKEPLEEALPDHGHEHLPTKLRDAKVLVFCNHCDNPPCTRVCPTGATWKRDDGVVMMDWHRCIGCRYCIAACPYGSRSFNWRDPRPQVAAVDPVFPTRTRGVVEKCNLCEERLAVGQAPACVEACSHKAIVFGDLENAESDVRRVLAERTSVRRRPALGTNPQIYYLL
jgi:molybdopterin-containing oxidoreductase family iron-sulfur binding subunit